MDMEALRAIPGPQAMIEALYEGFNEAGRLQSQAGAVEFHLSTRFIAQSLPPAANILDLGAGTGRYSHHFAAQGHRVLAVDLVDKHTRAIMAGKTPGMHLDVQCQEALQALAACPDGAYDAVLLMGPLYHLHAHEDRLQCLRECGRITKPGGFIYPAFINADMVILTMTLLNDNTAYMINGDYDKERFVPENFPFQFDTLRQAEALIEEAGLQIACRIASDMLNELCADAVNAMRPKEYAQWLEFQWHLCSQPHFLGASSHWLFCVRAG